MWNLRAQNKDARGLIHTKISYFLSITPLWVVDPLGVLTTIWNSGMHVLPFPNWASMIMVAKEQKARWSYMGSTKLAWKWDINSLFPLLDKISHIDLSGNRELGYEGDTWLYAVELKKKYKYNYFSNMEWSPLYLGNMI